MHWLLRFEAGEEVDLEAMAFLKHWLLHHILQEDRAYVPFLQAAIAHAGAPGAITNEAPSAC